MIAARKHRRYSLGATVVLFAALAVTGCSGQGSPTCKDFLAQSSDQQLETVKQWYIDQPGALTGNTGLLDFATKDWTEKMLEYCPDNPDDKLSDLEQDFGVG